MRDLVAIQSDNRRAAIHRNDAALYDAFLDLIGKVKGAGWPEHTYRNAEELVRKIEFSATGNQTKGVPAKVIEGEAA